MSRDLGPAAAVRLLRSNELDENGKIDLAWRMWEEETVFPQKTQVLGEWLLEQLSRHRKSAR
jgi:hypothetical protein